MTKMILAPLRGVTVRCFRETFAAEIAAAGFEEAFTPFVAAMPGVDPAKDRELRGGPVLPCGVKVTPQFLGKDPAALRSCLEAVKAAGFDTADLNCGCPFPMIRRKGRGSGILKTPDVLRRMLEVGCEVMGAGRFSVKARLGVERGDELLSLMPMLNVFPLRFLTVHGRIARQMYEGECDAEAVRRVVAAAEVPIVLNGDMPFPPREEDARGASADGVVGVMIGRSFIRSLGARGDACELLRRYVETSRAELSGNRPVLGRMKELVSYWRDIPRWRRAWPLLKVSSSIAEFLSVVNGVTPS